MDYAIGIDIGSTCAKTAVLAADGSFALLSARPTGWSSVDTAESIRAELEAAHFSPEACPCVATGYGRVAVPYAGRASRRSPAMRAARAFCTGGTIFS